MKFAENLRNWRISQGILQRQLAEKLNVSMQTLSHWETGYTEPSIQQLIALADFFDTTVDELIGRTN